MLSRARKNEKKYKKIAEKNTFQQIGVDDDAGKRENTGSAGGGEGFGEAVEGCYKMKVKILLFFFSKVRID